MWVDDHPKRQYWLVEYFAGERQRREQRWLPSAYDTQRVSQPYNSTQSPRQCRISSRPYSPYPKSHHLPKIVRFTICNSLPHPTSHSLHTLLYAVKAGYPPRSLTAVIPELPLSSLGLAPGDQLIVVQKSGSAAPSGVTSVAAPTGTSSSSSPVNPTYPGHTPAAARPTPSSNPAPSKIEDVGPDYVSTDGGYLIHTVRSNIMNYQVNYG